MMRILQGLVNGFPIADRAIPDKKNVRCGIPDSTSLMTAKHPKVALMGREAIVASSCNGPLRIMAKCVE